MKYILIFISISLLLPDLISQSSTRPYRHYKTQKVQANLLNINPQLKINKKNIEKNIVRFMGANKPVTIPIVFHIISPNTSNLISEDQVLSQITALNRDFSMAETTMDNPAMELEGFEELAVNTEILFCLAGETPENESTTGIKYYTSPNIVWGENDAIKDGNQQGVAPWKVDNYLNVWVGTLADSVSGYAQMPGGDSLTDGIVIDYRFFGIGGTSISPYDEGKTLTHLVGNYLGLYDLWSETNYCSDDYVNDTPIHNSKHFGCLGYKQVSLCIGHPVEMTMNFMDNTDDACQKIFTKGQKRRMQAILGKSGPRNKLTEGVIACADISSLQNEIAYRQSNTISDNLATALPSNGDLSMSVFPNPAKNTINIKVISKGEGIGLLEGINVLGKKVFSKQQHWNKGENLLIVNSELWKSGTYFFQLKRNEKIVVAKVVVSK